MTMRFGLLSDPEFRRSLGLHSPSLAMVGQCGCLQVCRGETFDVAAAFAEGVAAASEMIGQFDRGLLGGWSGEVPAVTGGSDLSVFLVELDAVVAEHEADRGVWPESWSWGPPAEDWEYE